MEPVRACVACGHLCEPPLTYVADAAGELIDVVVCLACLPGGAEPDDSRAGLGREDG